MALAKGVGAVAEAIDSHLLQREVRGTTCAFGKPVAWWNGARSRIGTHVPAAGRMYKTDGPTDGLALSGIQRLVLDQRIGIAMQKGSMDKFERGLRRGSVTRPTGRSMPQRRRSAVRRKSLLCVLTLIVAAFALAGPSSALGETASESFDPATSPFTAPLGEAEAEWSSGPSEPAFGPFIASEKDDYAPAELVGLVGGNWAPDEPVEIVVADEEGSSWRHTGQAVAGGDGNLSYYVRLPDWFVATYTVTATGQLSGKVTTTFADSVAQGGTPVTASNSGSGPTGQELTINAPAVAAGDVLMAQIAATDSVSSTQICAPPGWSTSTAAPRDLDIKDSQNKIAQQVFYRVATANQAVTSYRWEFRNNTCSGALVPKAASGGIIRYSGVDTTTPIDVAAGAGASNSSTTASAPSVNTTEPNTRVIRYIGVFKNTTISPSTTPPRIYATGSAGGKERAIAAFDAAQAGAGATNTFAATLGSSAEWVAQTVVLREAQQTNRVTQTSVTRTFGTNPSIYGDNLTFNAAVTATSGNPSNVGSVTFKRGATTLCSNVSLGGTNGNTASCSTSALEVGSHSITAQYSGTTTGSPTFDPSTSSALAHSVDKKNLTVEGAVADDKAYDGSTAATVDFEGASLEGVVEGDSVSIDGSGYAAEFASEDVGSDIAVTVTGVALGGADAGNYTVSQPAGLEADITARNLTVTANGVNKVYDGTTDATVTLSTDKVTGDAVSADYSSASFTDKHVGTSKGVHVGGISISGDDASNYNLLNTTATTTANITAKAVTGKFDAANKVWDGNTSATITKREVVGVVAGDNVELSGGTATFDNANVGQDKTVTLSGATLSGADTGNYSLSSVATARASITAWNAQGHGFYQPVGVENSVFVPAPGILPAATPTTVWNVAKGGSTIPLKFNIYAGGVEKTSTSDIKGFTAVKLSTCTSGAGMDNVEFVTTGSTVLRYDTTDRQFIQNWKTPTVTGDTCYRASVTFQDDSSLSAFFRLRR
jgi:YDG domain-containing protein/Big-like domain-containing protein